MRSLISSWRRRQPAPQAHVFWRLVYPAVVVAAAVAVLILFLAGGRELLRTTVEPVETEIVLEPDEPGYLEFVGVTPTLLSLHTDNGELTGVTLIARTGIDAGGGIVLLPADLQVAPGIGGSKGETISDLYAQGGLDAVEPVAEILFGIGFDEVVETTTGSLADSMIPAAPLPYVLVDDLSQVDRDGATRVVYESGRYELSAAEAADVYALRNPGEADVNRVQRQRAMWEAWLEVISRAADPAAAAPPPSSPLSPFLQALGAGTTVVEVPPLQSLVFDPASPPQYELTYLPGDQGRSCGHESWLRNRILELVPRPRQPESFLRPRVKLLDGTGDPAIRDGLVDDIIAAGGVVTEIGNADEFSAQATRFHYHREELVNDLKTNCIAIQLGVDMTLIESDEGGAGVVDITVTVGLDQVAR